MRSLVYCLRRFSKRVYFLADHNYKVTFISLVMVINCQFRKGDYLQLQILHSFGWIRSLDGYAAYLINYYPSFIYTIVYPSKHLVLQIAHLWLIISSVARFEWTILQNLLPVHMYGSCMKLCPVITLIALAFWSNATRLEEKTRITIKIVRENPWKKLSEGSAKTCKRQVGKA